MKKEEIRRLFPECCKFADAMRTAFGDGVRLVYAKEAGREIGRQVEVGVAVSAVNGDCSMPSKKTDRR